MSETTKTPVLCRCGAAARPGQRDCSKCHRDRQKSYRRKAREELLRLRAAAARSAPSDPETQAAYEARFKSRAVVVFAADGNVHTGTVVGFLPNRRLAVRDDKGSTTAVKLDNLIEDIGRIYE